MEYIHSCLSPVEILDPTLPHPLAFGIPVYCKYPPYLRISSSKNPLLLSEFQKGVHGIVWIFSESPLNVTITCFC